MTLPCTYKPPRTRLADPCDMCGHTGLVHPGQHNPGLDTCALCQLLPARDHTPAEPTPPPAPPTQSAHIIIGDNGWIAGTTDEQAANTKAREIQGVVISWVVTADYRQK